MASPLPPHKYNLQGSVNYYSYFEKVESFDNIEIYFDRSGFAETVQKIQLKIEGASWFLFENSKCFWADSINVYSTTIATLFFKMNILKGKDLFKQITNEYDDSGFIGIYNDSYNVFFPKIINRCVLSEKINSKKVLSEQFDISKKNKIEIFNSKFPEQRITIILNNI